MLKRVKDWSTSSASNDSKGNKSSYGAGSTDHQFSASACAGDAQHKKDFGRMYSVIASLLPRKEHYAFQAGRYTRGHYIDAHDDAAYSDVLEHSNPERKGEVVLYSRDIALVYYLTKNWSDDNGGSFIDLVGGQAIVPEFNTCILFHVPRLHRVEPVLNNLVRYSIFGWFLEKGRLYELETGTSQKEDFNVIGSVGKKRKKKKQKNSKIIQ